MNTIKTGDIKQALEKLADPLRATNSARFFKTGPGQYGEGDKFIGVTVPDQRKVAKKFRQAPMSEVIDLLQSPVHEHRLTALFIMVDQYRRGDEQIKKQIASLYHKNRAYVNNWDLVDSSAPYIIGDYLINHSPNVLFRLASSKSIWDRRMAVISTFAFIKENQFDLTLKIADMLLNDKEDLIHKAVGWALREVGKKDTQKLLDFLDHHANKMPRTALRYALEKLDAKSKQHYMSL